MSPSSTHSQFLWFATVLLLVSCFVVGGSSQDVNSGIVLTQLAALPLGFFAIAYGLRAGRFVGLGVPLAVLAFLLAIPALQLMPLPESLWTLPTPRLALLQDLRAVGVSDLDMRWSLRPATTERELLGLLPAASIFLAVLGLGRRGCRAMLWTLVTLAAFSLLLGIAQFAVSQDSFLNPFPRYAPSISGVFANPNHQADMLVIGIVLAVTLCLDERRCGRLRQAVLAIGLAAFFFLALPLVGSRAGVIIALVAVAFVLLSMEVLAPGYLREAKRLYVLLPTIGISLTVGIGAALAWMRVDDPALAESRSAMASLALTFGWENAPFGGGFGSFVPLFQQSAGDMMVSYAYINAAHQEYAQWWMDGGVLAVAGVFGVLMLLGATLWRLLLLPAGSRRRAEGLAALSGVLVIALHSTVDYPLRTPALLAVFSALAGMTIAAARPGQRASGGPPIPERLE